MNHNYLEDQFSERSFIKDDKVFDPSFIPLKIRYRENQLILLSKIFLPIIKNPNSISKKVIITGNVGVGKTLTVHKFGEMIKESADIRNINLEFIHINCRSIKTSYYILKLILSKLIGNVPGRGLSIIELFNILADYLLKNNSHLVLVLDELNFLLKKDTDLVYLLTRSNELGISIENHISLIGILKDIKSLSSYDQATTSTLQNEVIKFNNYDLDQISNILKDRIIMGFHNPNIISDYDINIISSYTHSKGDLRIGLKIIRSAALLADKEKKNKILTENIRSAISKFSNLSLYDISFLKNHELYLLLALCNILSSSNQTKIILNEIKDEYSIICDFYNEKPRSNTQIWKYIKNLSKYNLINTYLQNKNIKGRKTVIEINNYSVKELKNIINEQIKKKMKKNA